jgi:7-carboxy-7-deazaguanine synthase
MFGKNKISKAIHEEGAGPERQVNGQLLQVNNIFGTIQGEGPYSGRPAIFIRLTGCNLSCTFCDTEFEKGELMDIPTILGLVKLMVTQCATDLVVLTGGEPMRQQINPLLWHLKQEGFHTQIETAGTLWPPAVDIDAAVRVSLEDLLSWGGPGVSIVCSPKTPKVHPMIEKHCQHFKYIVRTGEISALDGIPVMSTQRIGVKAVLYRPAKNADRHPTIWVQPMDEYLNSHSADAEGRLLPDVSSTRSSMRQCVEVAKRYGYRVSLQQHKILEVE